MFYDKILSSVNYCVVVIIIIIIIITIITIIIIITKNINLRNYNINYVEFYARLYN